jgi:ectoine hydroxylase-related dioxygenase (phytanoyl-CoA dioxygenase family)
LDDKSLGTILRESDSQLEVQPEVREGEILFFPSNIWHRSPPNNTNTRKTVVPFNISLK